MRPHIGATKLVATGSVLAVGLTSAVLLTSGSAQASATYGYAGYAHGTYVYASSADSGPQVTSLTGCTRKVGLKSDNSAGTVKASGESIAHSVRTSTETHNDARGDGTTSTGSADDLKIGSLLEMTGAKTYARAVAKNGVFVTTADSTFSGVKIGGVPVPALTHPKANTTVTVPGLGFVVFNRQVFTKTAQNATSSASAVLIHTTVSNPYFKKGSTVAMLLTNAQVGGVTSGMLVGRTWLTRTRTGDTVTSGPTSFQTTCVGTDGKVERSNVAGVVLPNVGEVGAGATYKSGVLGASPSGWMKALTGGVNLGGGKVNTGAISAKAMAKKVSGKVVTSWETGFGSIVIDGKVIPVPKTPNQKYDVPGFGTITFNKVKQDKNRVSITAIEMWVKSLNTTVEIAHAEAGVGS